MVTLFFGKTSISTGENVIKQNCKLRLNGVYKENFYMEHEAKPQVALIILFSQNSICKVLTSLNVSFHPHNHLERQYEAEQDHMLYGLGARARIICSYL